MCMFMFLKPNYSQKCPIKHILNTNSSGLKSLNILIKNVNKRLNSSCLDCARKQASLWSPLCECAFIAPSSEIKTNIELNTLTIQVLALFRMDIIINCVCVQTSCSTNQSHTFKLVFYLFVFFFFICMCLVSCVLLLSHSLNFIFALDLKPHSTVILCTWCIVYYVC